MEEALRQSQKLEGLGVLAGGIAHDFNNLLTAIMGNLNLAQLKLPEGSPALTHLEAVENTVLKASGLTRQMLAYSGKGRFKVKPQNLSVLVRDIEHLMRATVSGRGALELDLAGELPSVEGDAAQIQQVVMNLVTNAAEAFGDRPGTLRVATARVDLDEDRLRREFPAQSLDPGPHVMLEVEDTGQGMAPEVLARIFDPFFSTKVRGRGLGLSALMGILRGHRAGIRVRSAPGQGSLFQVLFPATDAPALAAPGAVPVPEAALRGRVLLVDDEPVILDSMGAALENMGFEVVPAHDGVEALERFQEGRPDLVIMDLTMPRMDGATAFGRMQELDPRVPVILSSGYDRQALEGARPAAFVQKPYRFQELKDLVREVMAAR
jgi:CheY-like chemotaxis protein